MKNFSVLFFLLLSLGLMAQISTPTITKRTSASNPNKATLYVTAKGTNMRLSQNEDILFEPFAQPLETQVCIFVDPARSFQTMIGIGGAITDASAEVFAKLPQKTQQQILDSYYSKKSGIGYNLARTNIGSCDFSSESYGYVDEKDSTLKSFSIAPDLKFKIPLIKQAFQKAGNLNLFVSPWSPPAWMKDNNSLVQGGKLLDKYRPTWANHFVRFIQEYEKQGIPVWGLTVQNEPMAKQKWESCIYTAEEERDFVKYFLGPTLHNKGMASKKLIVWDHNRDLIYQRASTICNDPLASRYVWGIGFHWYETWTGGEMQFENLRRTHESFPDKNLVFTEGCVEKYDFKRINDWSLGERYGNSILNDLNAGTVAWTDWNILLDDSGGPNHVGNFCFAPIHANTKTGELFYTNSYYYIGHFSKFIASGAKRIAASSNREKLQTTAFLNPDGTIVVIILNKSDDKIPLQLNIGKKAAAMTSEPHSIMTSLIK